MLTILDRKFLDLYLLEDRNIQNTTKDQEYKYGLKSHGSPAWFKPAIECSPGSSQSPQ